MARKGKWATIILAIKNGRGGTLEGTGTSNFTAR